MQFISGHTTIYVPFSYTPEKFLLQIHSDTGLAEGVDINVVYEGQKIEITQQIFDGNNVVIQLDKTAFSPVITTQFFTVVITQQKAEKSKARFSLKGLTFQ